VDHAAGAIDGISFSSNGCGYMMAAADVLAEYINGKRLAELQGLGAELRDSIQSELDVFPETRGNCLDSCIGAARAAFADLRVQLIEEFRGEKALICTCFGVAEETIEFLISEHKLKTVEEVTSLCRAGSGCGSCSMLISEMLDARQHQV
jgi:bacterioferritin-associated ferredoxin